MTKTADWYERRSELRPGQIFTTQDGSVVLLDRSVPGDATAWYVADWSNGWSYYDSKVEASELITMFATPEAALRSIER